MTKNQIVQAGVQAIILKHLIDQVQAVVALNPNAPLTTISINPALIMQQTATLTASIPDDAVTVKGQITTP